MPRWKALPDELDPQVREFASQLRRLVDRSGLSIAAVADRTGYSKTSWERYLNGRLLAPKGAIVALAEVTGTNPVHLTTMWELAERAWSRSEMRHDMTMEAIRISQARAALGEFGRRPPAKGGSERPGRAGSATATPGIAGPAGVSPTVPPQPTAPEPQDSAVRQPSADVTGLLAAVRLGAGSSGGTRGACRLAARRQPCAGAGPRSPGRRRPAPGPVAAGRPGAGVRLQASAAAAGRPAGRRGVRRRGASGG